MFGRCRSQELLGRFFNVFGITRRRVASFEAPVKMDTGIGFIVLLWKGVLLVEHKSRGKDLDRAARQALDRAVDAAYGCTIFKSEAERVAFLFERYQQLNAPLDDLLTFFLAGVIF